jgi:DNA topoisomerase-2
MSIRKFKGKLGKLREEKVIKKLKDDSDDNLPHFTITMEDEEVEPTLKSLKLVDTLSTSNMVLFDEEGKLRKFASIEDIMVYFCTRRYNGYKIRKEGQLAKLKEDLKWAANKIRFIKDVDQDKLVILDRDEDELDRELVKMGYDQKPVSKTAKSSKKESETEAEAEESEDESEELDEEASGDENENSEDVKEASAGAKPNHKASFDYLLKMQARSLNIRSKVYKKLETDHKNFQIKIAALEKITIESMWKEELAALKQAYPKWLKIADEGEDPDISVKKPKPKPSQPTKIAVKFKPKTIAKKRSVKA